MTWTPVTLDAHFVTRVSRSAAAQGVPPPASQHAGEHGEGIGAIAQRRGSPGNRRPGDVRTGTPPGLQPRFADTAGSLGNCACGKPEAGTPRVGRPGLQSRFADTAPAVLGRRGRGSRGRGCLRRAIPGPGCHGRSSPADSAGPPQTVPSPTATRRRSGRERDSRHLARRSARRSSSSVACLKFLDV